MPLAYVCIYTHIYIYTYFYIYIDAYVHVCVGSAARLAASAAEAAKARGQGVPHKMFQSRGAVWCKVCGCYGQMVLRDLLRPCTGPAGSGPRAAQLARLMAGKHPNTTRLLAAARPLGGGIATETLRAKGAAAERRVVAGASRLASALEVARKKRLGGAFGVLVARVLLTG